jgi:hypothetical protein
VATPSRLEIADDVRLHIVTIAAFQGQRRSPLRHALATDRPYSVNDKSDG